jgi:hypothetical protein
MAQLAEDRVIPRHDDGRRREALDHEPQQFRQCNVAVAVSFADQVPTVGEGIQDEPEIDIVQPAIDEDDFGSGARQSRDATLFRNCREEFWNFTGYRRRRGDRRVDRGPGVRELKAISGGNSEVHSDLLVEFLRGQQPLSPRDGVPEDHHPNWHRSAFRE